MLRGEHDSTVSTILMAGAEEDRWFLMDRAGRRPILLSGAIAMAIALTATGWWIYIDQAITTNAVVICVVVYNAAFGTSWGPVPWCVYFKPV
jgi:hypothetical protein